MLFSAPLVALISLTSGHLVSALPHLAHSSRALLAEIEGSAGRLVERALPIPAPGHSIDPEALRAEFARMRGPRSIATSEPVAEPALRRQDGLRPPRVKPAKIAAAHNTTVVANSTVRPVPHHEHSNHTVVNSTSHHPSSNGSYTPIVPSTINVTVVYSSGESNSSSRRIRARSNKDLKRSRKVSPGVATFVHTNSKRAVLPRSRKASPAIEVFRNHASRTSTSTPSSSKRDSIPKSRKRSPALDTFRRLTSPQRLTKRSFASDSTYADSEPLVARAPQPSPAEMDAAQRIARSPIEIASGPGAGQSLTVRTRQRRTTTTTSGTVVRRASVEAIEKRHDHSSRPRTYN